MIPIPVSFLEILAREVTRGITEVSVTVSWNLCVLEPITTSVLVKVGAGIDRFIDIVDAETRPRLVDWGSLGKTGDGNEEEERRRETKESHTRDLGVSHD